MIVLILQVLGTLYIPTLTANIVNNGIMKGDIHQVYITGGLMIIIAAELGVGVRNVVDGLKKDCDYITKADNNESTIAEVIRKFILKL